MTGPVIVTGAAGFIGQRLVTYLRASGQEVVGWTRSMGDLRDTEAVARVVRELQPATVYHLAACNPALSEADWTVPAQEVAMVQNLAAALPSGGRMVHCGSMSEFGYGGTLDENDPRIPRSIYGFAKACASDRAMALAATGACDIRVACLFGVYGPGEGTRRLLPHLVGSLLSGQPVALGDETRLRDFVHVDDVCRFLAALAAIETPPHPMVNIGTGHGVTIGHLCHQVAAWLGVDPALLHFGKVPSRPIDEDVLIANVVRLADLGPPPPQHWMYQHGLARDYVTFLVEALANSNSMN